MRVRYLVIGLGNVGAAYTRNRHNVGFMVLDALAQAHAIDFCQDRLAFVSSFHIGRRQVRLIKPTTCMNRSGRSVRYWMKKGKIAPENLLVITDDIALPFGMLRLRAAGSSGGHNGLKSVEEYLGGTNYPRLRFGVGHAFAQGGQAAYVLQDFDAAAHEDLQVGLKRAQGAILSFCEHGIEKTMSLCNRKS